MTLYFSQIPKIPFLKCIIYLHFLWVLFSILLYINWKIPVLQYSTDLIIKTILVYALNTKTKKKKIYISSYFFHESVQINNDGYIGKKKKSVLYRLKILASKHKNQKQKINKYGYML